MLRMCLLTTFNISWEGTRGEVECWKRLRKSTENTAGAKSDTGKESEKSSQNSKECARWHKLNG
jgi:hypothetical protein